VKESDTSKEAAVSASTPFQGDDVKLANEATRPGAETRPLKGKTRFRSEISVANLLQVRNTGSNPQTRKLYLRPSVTLLLSKIVVYNSKIRLGGGELVIKAAMRSFFVSLFPRPCMFIG